MLASEYLTHSICIFLFHLAWAALQLLSLTLLDDLFFWCSSLTHALYFSLDSNCESDILECEVKWDLESITMNKASGGDGIPVELFQILEDDAVKMLHSICHKFGKLSSGHRTRKGQFSFQSQRKAMAKNAQITTLLHSSHTLVK